MKLSIPLFAEAPPRVTYYTVEMLPERCPSWHLHYAFEKGDICLSPALRPCDIRNDKNVMLLSQSLAEEFASYAEPIMQRRYGALTQVSAVVCEAPADWASKAPFNLHADKITGLIRQLKAKGYLRSGDQKSLPKAPVVKLPTV